MLFLQETIIDVKRQFYGWRLLVPILITVTSILMSLYGGEDEIGTLMIFYFIWTTITMSPKINKLHYLLPGDSKSRIGCLLRKSLGILIFNLMNYVFFLSICVILSDYRFIDELQRIICQVIPFLISYTSMCMNYSYNALSSEKND